MLSKKMARELLYAVDDSEFFPMGAVRNLCDVVEREDKNSNFCGTTDLEHIGRLILAEARRVLAAKGAKKK